MLDPKNKNKVISTTYVYNNPNSIQNAKAKGWVINKIQNPQGILHYTYGLQTKQDYIDKLIEEYKISEAKHMHKPDRVSQLRNLTPKEIRNLILKEKSAIFNNTVKKVPIGSSFNTPNDVTQAIKVAKNILGLSNNSNSNNTPAANNAGNAGRNSRCPKGSSCAVMGGRRTRRAKSRRAKSRRTRRS